MSLPPNFAYFLETDQIMWRENERSFQVSREKPLPLTSLWGNLLLQDQTRQVNWPHITYQTQKGSFALNQTSTHSYCPLWNWAFSGKYYWMPQKFIKTPKIASPATQLEKPLLSKASPWLGTTAMPTVSLRLQKNPERPWKHWAA